MNRFRLLPVIFVLVSVYAASGQSSSITLGFTAINNQQKIIPDSIYIENLTKGTDTLLIKHDTALVLFIPAGINDGFTQPGKGLSVSPNYPNPFKDQTDFWISLPGQQTVDICITGISGNPIASYSNTLPAGTHSFTFIAGKENLYVCSVKGINVSTAMKMVRIGSGEDGDCRLRYNGNSENRSGLKSISSTDNFGFTIGDILRFTGYAKTITAVKGSDVLEDTPSQTKTYLFEITEGVPCRDIPYFTYAGQVYNTVKIGNQCWMKENLNIGKMMTATWQNDNDTIEKYCYNNDPLLCNIYGGLYQWEEMMNYKEDQQTQGICPEGWHIPSASDWEVLNSATGGSETAGMHLKEAGNEHWDEYLGTYSDNSTGFSGLPGGRHFYTHYFEYIGMYGLFWSSTMNQSNSSLSESLYWKNSTAGLSSSIHSDGYSVRCLLNSNRLPNVITSNISNISDTSAVSGGEVIDEGSAPVTSRGVCWSTNGTPVITGPHTTNGSGPGAYSGILQFLQPGTTYYYRAYATNQYGTSYGIVDDFTTLVVVPPVVVTWPAIEITDTSAIGVGYLHDDGNGIILERGICWSTNENPTIDDQHTHDTTTNIIYYNEITGLSPNTTYYFRAYARNKAGLDYSFDDSPLITKSGIDYTIPCPGFPTITYENQIYHTVQIGEQCWLKENLNVGSWISAEINSSDNEVIEKYCYYDDIESCNRYGGLYQWNEVMNYQTQEESKGICPEGWHIPSNNDWNALSEFVGGGSVSGGALKETGTNNWLFPNTGATDIVGFSAMPGGHRLTDYHWEWGWYMGSCEKSYFWTSTLNSQFQSPINRNIGYNSMEMRTESFGANWGYSVRCLKD
jgi:uncharacterized protein (TIGR02145 family)